MAKNGRRSHGDGGVFRYRDRWAAVLNLGFVDGKRKRRWVYGRTEAEVLAKLRDLRKAQDAGQDLTAERQTVGDWLDHWVDDIKAHDGTRPSTLARYRDVIDRDLKPTVGKIPLDKLAPKDVQRVLSARRGTYKPATLVKVHAVLRSALADAERLELVSRNVARAVRPPSLAGEEHRRVLTPAEARQFLAAAESDRLFALFSLSLTLGLRRGEVIALRWQDVDLGRRELRVVRSAQRIGGTLRIVEPKTARSRRTVPLPANAVRLLKRHRWNQDTERSRAGERWEDHGLVFASTVGTLLEPRNVNRRFEQLRERAGLPWLRLHDLRHACATFLLAAGVEPRTVMEILGHSTVRMTMERYGHVIPERMRMATEAIEAYMREQPSR